MSEQSKPKFRIQIEEDGQLLAWAYGETAEEAMKELKRLLKKSQNGGGR